MGSVDFFKKTFKFIKILIKLCFVVIFIILFVNYINLEKEYYNIKRNVEILQEKNISFYSEISKKINDINEKVKN